MSCQDGSNEYPQSMFRAEIWKQKLSEFLSEKFHLFGGKIFTGVVGMGGGGGGGEGSGVGDGCWR